MHIKSIIATYPRSGKTFFISTLAYSTLIQLPYTHLHEGETENILDEYKNIITIIRNPIDCLSSLITMEYFYYLDLQNLYENNLNFFIENKIKPRIQQYENFYEIMLRRSNIIISFESLIQNTENTIKKISDCLNLEIKKNDFKNYTQDKSSVNFLKTSQNQKIYPEILKIIESQNLNKSESLYNQLKEKVNI